MQYIIEVRRVRTKTDPSISIFTVSVNRDGSEWPETFGSAEKLQDFLLGLKVALVSEGYPVQLLQWAIPDHWQEPSGIRWTFQQGADSLYLLEELHSDGRVIKI